MEIRYCPVREDLQQPELGGYVSYGICAMQGDGGSWAEVDRVSDVSCDRDFVERLAELCTRLELDPMHLPDVVKDAVDT